MTIATRVILVLTVGFWGLFAMADANPETNSRFVEHLNYYHQDLHLSVAKSADAKTIEGELSALELILGQQLQVGSGQLMHVACNNPACCSGGCCASVCAYDESTTTKDPNTSGE